MTRVPPSVQRWLLRGFVQAFTKERPRLRLAAPFSHVFDCAFLAISTAEIYFRTSFLSQSWYNFVKFWDGFLWLCWCHFGLMLGSFWGHVGVILGSCWGHFGSFWRYLKGYRFLVPFFDRFGSLLGAKLSPSWLPSRAKLASKSALNFINISM